jgi:NAD(P)H dehydrogenase (quinone)
MKIAITAASGNLGKAIVKQLLQELSNEQVIAIARSPEKVNFPGVEARRGDYNSRKQFDEALRGTDAVLVVSGRDAPDVRIQQHRNVIFAAKDAGVKKIVYTSVIGEASGSSFSPIVASNRHTEEDIKNSGVEWVIGRNGLYMEPDVEYIENYKKAGKIANCAADGKCAYTTRDELAYAYSKMLLEENHNGNTYYLTGEPITQQKLTDYLNMAFDTHLIYETMSVEDYKKERIADLGEFMGTIIAGIYQGIRSGAFDKQSDYKSAAGREHISWSDYFQQIP